MLLNREIIRVLQEYLIILNGPSLSYNPVNLSKTALFGLLANLQALTQLINHSNTENTIPPNGIIKRRILFLSGAHSHSEATSDKRN